MGMVLLKVLDEKGEEIEIKDLTDTGIQMLRGEIEQLQEKIDVWVDEE